MFELCLRVWSFLGQTPAGETATTVATQAAAAEANAPAAESMGLKVVRYILMVIYLLVCIGLIAIVLNKNTKSDGLSGMLGAGANQNSYHGKKSFEENMNTAANYLAVSFIVLSMVISLVMR